MAHNWLWLRYHKQESCCAHERKRTQINKDVDKDATKESTVSKIVEKIILARVPYREEIIPRAKHVTYFDEMT